MKRFVFATVCATIATLTLGTGSVSAQPPVPGGGYARPPVFSPYLNLLRGGGSPALNYYGIVRPEMQFRQAIQNLTTQTNLNEQAIGNLAATGGALPTTGHSTYFMNYGGYFMSGGGGQAGGSPVGGGQVGGGQIGGGARMGGGMPVRR